MTRTLLYVSGEPGTGKSTLMAELTSAYTRIPQEPEPDAPARDRLIHPDRPAAVELGRRRDTFSGTDALPQTAITAAEAYLRTGRAATEAPLLLAEGARLANRRFLVAAREAWWYTVLLHLSGEEVAAERRAKRAAALGVREQNRAWVRGRATAARNLANTATGWGVLVLWADAALPPAELAHAARSAVPGLR